MKKSRIIFTDHAVERAKQRMFFRNKVHSLLFNIELKEKFAKSKYIYSEDNTDIYELIDYDQDKVLTKFLFHTKKKRNDIIVLTVINKNK